MGIPTFIASGDRVAKLEKMADYLGIPRDRVFGVATPTIKAQIVADLQGEYDTVRDGGRRDQRPLRNEKGQPRHTHRRTARR